MCDKIFVLFSAFVFFQRRGQMLPAAGWTAPAPGTPAVAGQGIRSIQWCPAIRNGADPVGAPATGAYLIIGGHANGGPLKNETGRAKFNLYRWDNLNAQPVRMVADLTPFSNTP